MIREVLGEFSIPLRGLVVALAAALLAYLWYDHHRLWAIGLGVAVCLSGIILDAIGRGLLPKRPVAAVWFLEGWTLTPAALAAVAGAVVVLITVALTLPTGTPTSTEKTVGALSTGLTAFITALFVAWAGDEKDSKVADHIKSAFWASYKRAEGAREPGVHYFVAGSRGERWVYADEFGGIVGWGHGARLKRARGIAKELQARTSDPPAQ